MSFMEKMERQWTERRLGVEPVTATASTRLTAEADGVWEILMAPELAHLTEPAVVSAFRVPGTPEGEVGEQQCFIQDIGEGRRSVTLLEFVELERPFRIVVRCPTYQTSCVITYDIEPDGTEVTLSCKVGILVETGLRRKVRPALQAETQSQLDQIAAVIRAGLTLPGAKGSSPDPGVARDKRTEPFGA